MNNSKTQVIFQHEARRLLFRGVRIVGETVGLTLGPAGKTVLIQSEGDVPHLTKDGITVSKSINPKNPAERMGALLLREAAQSTNEVAGDGTTTSTVLAYRMILGAYDLLKNKPTISVRELCQEFDTTLDELNKNLNKIARTLTSTSEIAQVATISANGDAEIGNLIADAMMKVRNDGIITVEDAKGMNTTLEITDGLMFDRGYLSPYFVNNQEKMNCQYSGTLVFLTDKKLTDLQPLIPVLEASLHQNKPLLIIAEDIDGAALQGLVLNRTNTQLRVVAVKAPGWGNHRHELLSDISVLTGASLISSSTGKTLENFSLSDFGEVSKVVVTAKSTTLVSNSHLPKVEERVNELKSQLHDVTLAPDEITKLKNRIARLGNGVAVIKVGGSTEMEMIEKKYRIEDALNATRAAVEEGIVPGGGATLARLGCLLDNENNDRKAPSSLDAREIIQDALMSPLRKICDNSDVPSGNVLETLFNSYWALEEKEDYGFDAVSLSYVNMYDAGIIDPVKVTRNAIKNAISVTKSFLTIDALVIDEGQADD